MTEGVWGMTDGYFRIPIISLKEDQVKTGGWNLIDAVKQDKSLSGSKDAFCNNAAFLIFM